MDGTATTLPIVKLGEAQAYLRIETGEEEALLAGLIRRRAHCANPSSTRW